MSKLPHCGATCRPLPFLTRIGLLLGCVPCENCSVILGPQDGLMRVSGISILGTERGDSSPRRPLRLPGKSLFGKEIPPFTTYGVRTPIFRKYTELEPACFNAKGHLTGVRRCMSSRGRQAREACMYHTLLYVPSQPMFYVAINNRHDRESIDLP